MLQNWLYMNILLAIQGLNGLVGFLESIKVSSAVEALKASLKPNAQVQDGGVVSCRGKGRTRERELLHIISYG